MTLKDRILELLQSRPGLTDREMTDELFGEGKPQQAVNAACRELQRIGKLDRQKGADGLTRNYPVDSGSGETQDPPSDENPTTPDEDAIKRHLESWLASSGWTVKVAWARERGVDIAATRKESNPWFIEVKGCGSRPQMNANYFLAILGQILQRMSDPAAKYSVAMPALPVFERLWKRLPEVAKTRAGITALFVDSGGNVRELAPNFRLEAEEGGPSLEEIADLADGTRRRLLRLLDWIEGHTNQKPEKAAERIARLTVEGKIPRMIAGCMRLVLTFRNCIVYENKRPASAEVVAWRAAWDAILTWARENGWQGA